MRPGTVEKTTFEAQERSKKNPKGKLSSFIRMP